MTQQPYSSPVPDPLTDPLPASLSAAGSGYGRPAYEQSSYDRSSYDPLAPEPAPHEPLPTCDLHLRVNGTERVVEDAWLGDSLLFVLRERLGLRAAKDGCGIGECGACAVLLDGQPVFACLVPAAAAVGRSLGTPEGYAADPRELVNEALVAHAGAGCGLCLPGVGISLRALLVRNKKPSTAAVREALSGHRCRCLPADEFVAVARQVLDEISHPAPKPAR
jgi:aerobic-type carbon monoxide dehydrogenase small subunit (CoxS/CutS family)